MISRHFILPSFIVVLASAALAVDRQQLACRRRPSTSIETNNPNTDVNLISPPPLPKSNLEISLDPLLISANWIYDHLQPRSDLFVNVIQNVSVAFDEIIANPLGPTTHSLVLYYVGYVIVAVFLLFIAIIWPLVGLFFCCCRCCCRRCCYGYRGDIYSPRSKSGSCRRGGCGFLFFCLLLVVIGACIGCFISAVCFRFSTTSTSSIDAAAEATSSAGSRKGGDPSDVDRILVTERIGASALDALDSVRQLGYTYAKILRTHVQDLTDSMMRGVEDLVNRLSHYLDNDWLGGANSTLDDTRTLQHNISTLVNDMTQLIAKHNEALASIDSCVFSAQRLKTDIRAECSETVTRECSRDLEQNLAVLDIPSVLQKMFHSLPPLDDRRIRNLERQRIGSKAEALLNVYSRDLDKIQLEAQRIVSGSSVRRSVLNTLNGSLGIAADLLQSRTDNLAASASKQIIALVCDADENKSENSNNDDDRRSVVAKFVGRSLDYTFYSLMAIASLIGLFVVFIGFSMLACCAGKSYYKRASCFAITAVMIAFLFATVLAISCLVVFLATALTYSEVCRPIARQDAQMFQPMDDLVTDALATGNFDGETENGAASKNWPPELIFTASKSYRTGTDAWHFSFGSTLASCSKNSSLMTALQLRLPQTRLADRLIKSVRSELQRATSDAILKIESRIEGIDEPSGELQRSLRELIALQIGQWQIPQYPSNEEIVRISSDSSISRLSLLVSKEIGAGSSLIDSIKAYDSTCHGNLISDQLSWMVSAGSSIEQRAAAIGRLAQNLTERIDSISKKLVGSSAQFRQVLADASRDLGNYLEVAARKKMGDFEEILARDETGRCTDAAAKIIATSEALCRPVGILSTFSLLLLGVVLVTLPLIWCIGAPFAQALRWPSTPIIPGLNPQMQVPGFEGLPLLDLLPRYQKIG